MILISKPYYNYTYYSILTNGKNHKYNIFMIFIYYILYKMKNVKVNNYYKIRHKYLCFYKSTNNYWYLILTQNRFKYNHLNFTSLNIVL